MHQQRSRGTVPRNPPPPTRYRIFLRMLLKELSGIPVINLPASKPYLTLIGIPCQPSQRKQQRKQQHYRHQPRQRPAHTLPIRTPVLIKCRQAKVAFQPLQRLPSEPAMQPQHLHLAIMEMPRRPVIPLGIVVPLELLICFCNQPMAELVFASRNGVKIVEVVKVGLVNKKRFFEERRSVSPFSPVHQGEIDLRDIGVIKKRLSKIGLIKLNPLRMLQPRIHKLQSRLKSVVMTKARLAKTSSFQEAGVTETSQQRQFSFFKTRILCECSVVENCILLERSLVEAHASSERSLVELRKLKEHSRRKLRIPRERSLGESSIPTERSAIETRVLRERSLKESRIPLERSRVENRIPGERSAFETHIPPECSPVETCIRRELGNAKVALDLKNLATVIRR